MVYFVIFIFILFFVFLDFLNVKNSQKKILVFISFLILLLFSGLRWETGSDWLSYYPYFTTLKRLVPFEPGFQLFNIAIKQFTNEYTVFLLSLTFVGLFLDYNVIKKYSPLPLLSILIFYSTFYFDFFGGIRASIAVGLCFFATTFLLKEKIIKFVLVVLIATTFHLSAFIFLIALLLKKIYIKNKYFVILLVLAFIISYFQVVTGIVNFLVQQFSEKYAIISKLKSYLLADYIPPSVNIFVQNSLAIFKRSLFLIIFLIFRKKTVIKFKHFDLFLNFYFFSIFLYITTSGNIEMLKRGSVFFSGFDIILLPMVISSVNNKNKIVILSIAIIYSLFRLITVLNVYPDLYFPYKSIFWFDEEIIRKLY